MSDRTLSYTLRVVTLGCATALAGCMMGDPDQADLDTEQSELDVALDGTTVRYGVDYSFSRPSPATLRADGYTFAARYESYDAGKNLTATEAHALIAAGLDVVSNWEVGASDALDGYSRGRSDAQAATAQFAADGAPATRPIYFSVDFDASPGQQATLNAYFDGVASVIGRNRTGAYGGYYVIKRLFDAGKIKWGWQTYAWSDGHWDARAQLRQIKNGILGGCCDKDEAMVADFGQWGHAIPTAEHGAAAVIDAGGVYHVFATNTAGTVRQAYYSGGAWHWQTLGGTLRGNPGVTYDPATGRFDVFGVGTDGAIWQRTYSNGAWAAWHAIGGSSFASGASALIDRNGVYRVFANDTSGTLHQGYYSAGAWHWQSLGGTLRGSPGVVYNPATHRFDVFGAGGDGAVWQRTYSNAAWSAWHSIGGSGFATGTSAVIDRTGTYHVFAHNTAGTLEQAYYTSTGWHWQSLGGTLKSNPGVAYTPATHRFDIFAAGADGAIWQRTYASGAWQAWHSIGGSAFSLVDGLEPAPSDERAPSDLDATAAQ